MDLEAMADIGLKGFTLFHVTQGVPIGDVKFRSDVHLDMLDHLAAESERLGLDFGLHNSDGWTSSGGPWVTPEMSMKNLVWSETFVRGGAVDMELAEPPRCEDYFETVAVLAYPALAAERALSGIDVRVTASDTDFDIDRLGKDPEGLVLPIRGELTDKKVVDGIGGTVTFDYGEPVSVRSVTATFLDGRHTQLTLETSDDAQSWTDRGKLPIRRPGKRVWATDAVIDTPPARYYRIGTNKELKLLTLDLSGVQTIANRMGRTGVARTSADRLDPIGEPVPGMVVGADSVIDLTDNLDGNRLQADLPEGQWTVLHMGMTSTGAINIPASAEGTGLEVDKMNREAALAHYDAFMGQVADRNPGSIDLMQIDSYEVGGQSWTDGFEDAFEARYGYKLTPYLPAWAGRFVGSADKTDAVLADARRLASEMVVENYYEALAGRAAEDGIRTTIEPYGFGPFNDVEAGGVADVPMGEFWLNRDKALIAAARSAAHTYGRDVVSTEAFTAMPEINWAFHPGMAKTQGDEMWALGVNEFTFHRYAHQANTHVAPGMVMNRWGANFDRTQPWWGSAGRAWMTYLARGQHMLRQGVPVRDALVVLGDASPITCLDQTKMDELLGARLAYDCLNTERLMAGVEVVEGRIVLESGAVYSALVLPDALQVTQPTARRIAQLAEAGAVIFGKLPSKPLGTHEKSYAVATVKVAEIARPLDELNTLSRVGVGIDGYPETLSMHRRAGEADIIFLSTPNTRAERLSLSVAGPCRVVEVWDPLDGSVTRSNPVSCEGGRTAFSWSADPREAVFIVLREATKVTKSAPAPASADLLDVDGPWTVELSGWNRPDASLSLEELQSLSELSGDDARFHAGRADYATEFEVAEVRADTRYGLDLGDVAVAARVTLNGQALGTVWSEPYRLDVTDALRTGTNVLEVAVDTLWTNRLIGDEVLPRTDGFRDASWVPTTTMIDWYKANQPPPDGPRSTFTTARFVAKDDPLVPAGLIGPVRLTHQAALKR